MGSDRQAYWGDNAQVFAYHSKSQHPDPAWMCLTQEFHNPFLQDQVILFGSMFTTRWFAFFSHLPEEHDSFLLFDKVICLYIELAFICLSNSHWIHSRKWRVTTF